MSLAYCRSSMGDSEVAPEPSTSGGLRAVVVGTFDIGETSRIVRFLTADRGRVAAVVRGARSSRRRQAGVLEPGSVVVIETRKSRGEIPDLVSFDLVKAPRRARAELERLAYLAYGCELCASLAPEEDAAPKLMGLLEAWTILLEEAAQVTTAHRTALEVKALAFAGYHPALTRCARCSEPLSEPCVFSVAGGGMRHSHCGEGKSMSLVWPAQAWVLLRRSMSEADAVKLDPGDAWLLSDFAEYHLAHRLRSREFLETLIRGVGGASVS